MGLDATVMCRCYAQGRTTAPPCEEHLVIDGEGYLALDLPWQGHEAEHEAFDTWLRSACEHPDMEVAEERISNWGGYRLFQEALGSEGWERFPTLHSVLPNANGGRVGPEDAARCLDELGEFEQRYTAEVAALIDSATDEVLHHHVQAYRGIFIWGGRAGVTSASTIAACSCANASRPTRRSSERSTFSKRSSMSRVSRAPSSSIWIAARA